MSSSHSINSISKSSSVRQGISFKKRLLLGTSFTVFSVFSLLWKIILLTVSLFCVVFDLTSVLFIGFFIFFAKALRYFNDSFSLSSSEKKERLLLGLALVLAHESYLDPEASSTIEFLSYLLLVNSAPHQNSL